MFCETGKICYETIKEAKTAVANLNKQDKKHKHNFYTCPHCKTFHTSTVKSPKKKLAQRREKYPFRYVPTLKEEKIFRKQSKSKKMSTPESNAPTQGPARELTFGEKSVGLTFNPGGHPSVNAIKEKAAQYIDLLNELRELTPNGEIKRQLSIAITEAQTSQMWAVKGVTWQY